MFDFSAIPSFFRTPEEALRQQQEQMAKIETIRQRILESPGRAASEDERIAIAYSEAKGAHELVIDPRALRMPSDELAEALLDVINRAREDARAQTSKIVQEEFAEEDMDPQSILGQMPQVESNLSALADIAKNTMGDMAALTERVKSMIPAEASSSADRANPEASTF